MNSKYKIVIIISLLLVTLSMSITTINYFVSLNSTEQQLKNQSLPLSLDNIYTVIQKNIIEPYLVSSMMAHDTFVKDWIVHEEKNNEKIKKYLSAIKNQYGMFTTFLVSENSGNYYTHEGLLETIEKENQHNKWYFDFKKSQKKHEINLDFNQHISNSLIMFINYKIFDMKYNFLGATGVGIKISYIDDLLKTFRQKHNFKVYFLNEDGEIVLKERKIISENNIKEMKHLLEYKEQIISKEPISIEFEKDDDDIYLLSTKYVPELNLYLIVEVKLADFTQDVKNIFYFNIFISFIISLLVILILIYLIKNYNQKLEFLAGNDQLTKLNNRRTFDKKLHHQMLLAKRNKRNICLAFMDVDNFKKINDTKGHAVGDKVLIRIASILKDNTRKTDILARWGGEEFVVSYIDSSLDDSFSTTENLRKLIESDYILNDLVKDKVTASFGLCEVNEEDNIDSLISRADSLMYVAKQSGKNRVITKKE